MKTWSYKTITQKAEKEITDLMKQAEKNAAKSDEFSSNLVRQWAYGVYIGWNALTTGWQQIGDKERLEALTKPEEKEAA